jgi:hypothetical protein
VLSAHFDPELVQESSRRKLGSCPDRGYTTPVRSGHTLAKQSESQHQLRVARGLTDVGCDSHSAPSVDLSSFIPRAKSLHELAPYIGKMRPELAGWAIEQVSKPGQRILDPFCGSGTVLLEGWARGREVAGLDLSPYAWLIATAKLMLGPVEFEYDVNARLEQYQQQVNGCMGDVDLRRVDKWVRSFYHPRTLRELLAWSWVLRKNKDPFFLAALMAIAHHQRPGFLSYPSSHTVPYLRTSKFPPLEFPELYEYRPLRPRLEKKIGRALLNINDVDLHSPRAVVFGNACNVPADLGEFDAIVTSPPYMGQLHYARDNRLRLALLGRSDWREIDRTVSPNYFQFTSLIQNCAVAWAPRVKKGGHIAILIGDTTNTVKRRLDSFVIDAITSSCAELRLSEVVASSIPDDRRTRKNCRGSSAELLLVFEKWK